jgi:hypothetical protein
MVQNVVKSHGVGLRRLDFLEVRTDDLLSSDAVIVGSSIYFGNVLGEVKSFSFLSWCFRVVCQRRENKNLGQSDAWTFTQIDQASLDIYCLGWRE